MREVQKLLLVTNTTLIRPRTVCIIMYAYYLHVIHTCSITKYRIHKQGELGELVIFIRTNEVKAKRLQEQTLHIYI